MRASARRNGELYTIDNYPRHPTVDDIRFRCGAKNRDALTGIAITRTSEGA